MLKPLHGDAEQDIIQLENVHKRQKAKGDQPGFIIRSIVVKDVLRGPSLHILQQNDVLLSK